MARTAAVRDEPIEKNFESPLAGIAAVDMAGTNGIVFTPDYNDLSEMYLWISTGAAALLLGAVVMSSQKALAPYHYGEYILLTVGLVAVLVLCYVGLLFWHSTHAKLLERQSLVEALREWHGEEQVLGLDGDGKGAFIIQAAKQLRVDVARKKAISLHTADSEECGARTMLNAVAEGVDQIVGVQSGLPWQIPYPAESFDVVLSTYSMTSSPFRQHRPEIIQAMWRVLKPGGQLCILDYQIGRVSQEIDKLKAGPGCHKTVRYSRPNFQKLGLVLDAGIVVVDKQSERPDLTQAAAGKSPVSSLQHRQSTSAAARERDEEAEEEEEEEEVAKEEDNEDNMPPLEDEVEVKKQKQQATKQGAEEVKKQNQKQEKADGGEEKQQAKQGSAQVPKPDQGTTSKPTGNPSQQEGVRQRKKKKKKNKH